MNICRARAALFSAIVVCMPLWAAAESDGTPEGNPFKDAYEQVAENQEREAAEKRKVATKPPVPSKIVPGGAGVAAKTSPKPTAEPSSKPAPDAPAESASSCETIMGKLKPGETAAAMKVEEVDKLAGKLADCLYKDSPDAADNRTALRSHLAAHADEKRSLARDFIHDVTLGYPATGDDWRKKALMDAGQTFAKGGEVPNFPQNLKPSALQLYCGSRTDTAAAVAKQVDCGVTDGGGGGVRSGAGQLLAGTCVALMSDAENKVSAAADPSAAIVAKNCGEAKAAAALTGSPRKPIGNLAGNVPAPSGDKPAAEDKKDASFMDKYGKAAGIGAGAVAGLLLAAFLGAGPLGLLVAALAGGVGGNALMNRAGASAAPVAAPEADDTRE